VGILDRLVPCQPGAPNLLFSRVQILVHFVPPQSGTHNLLIAHAQILANFARQPDNHNLLFINIGKEKRPILAKIYP